jgi:acid phosphatase type 7
MKKRQTRRRFLQVAGVGSVGIAGCTTLDPTEGGIGDDESIEDVEAPTSGVSTLFATWRGHDPANSVTLQWLISPDDATDPATVELSSEANDSESVVQTEVEQFGESDLSRHRAEPTDLEPDTRYLIAIDESDTDLSIQTAPTELDETFTFAEGGDIGTSANVPPLHEQAASWDPLFAFVGGDLAYADGEDENKWITFIRHWNEHMRSDDRLIPLVAAIGDHELKGREFFGTPEDAPFFYSLFDNTQRERAYWALDLGDSFSLIILDSNHTTEVEGAQTEWFEEALAERTEQDHLMAAYHIPAYPCAKPIDGEERGDIREHWVPLLEAHDIDIAFEHDDHAYKRTHLLQDGEPDPDQGILYVGDGAWGTGPRDVYSSEERPYLHVSESELHVIQVELEPDGSRRFQAVNPDGELVDQFDGLGNTLQAQVNPSGSL